MADSIAALLDHIYELATTEQQRSRVVDEHDYNAIDFDRYDD